MPINVFFNSIRSLSRLMPFVHWNAMLCTLFSLLYKELFPIRSLDPSMKDASPGLRPLVYAAFFSCSDIRGPVCFKLYRVMAILQRLYFIIEQCFTFYWQNINDEKVLKRKIEKVFISWCKDFACIISFGISKAQSSYHFLYTFNNLIAYQMIHLIRPFSYGVTK